MNPRTLLGYIVFIFVLQGLCFLLPSDLASLYVSLEVFAIGLGAIVWQKLLDHGKVADMGFRLNRNVVIGLLVVAVFAALQFGLTIWVPMRTDAMQIVVNPTCSLTSEGQPPLAMALGMLVIGGMIFFISCLFGEELAFRGYVLPKLSRLYGNTWAVVLCAIVFGVWHLPAYFSLYAGGAAEQGWGSLAIMLLAHGLSSIPICILYLTTREIYSVSIYHALVDVTQYAIIGNPALGRASENSLYTVIVSNESVLGMIFLSWTALSIPLMICLCRMGKPLVLRNDSTTTYESKSH